MSEVSVVIPSYNHARYIERTLRSIFSQTFKPKKLTIIDDGSKDESVEIIKRVLADCPFEHELIARENRGLCATLNEAFAATDGDYFTYIGSDDLWFPDFLKENVSLLDKRESAVLSFGHAFVIDENEGICDRTDNWTPFADGDMLPHLLRCKIFSSPSVVYRRSALEKESWNEDARLEDYEMYLKLTAHGEFARSEKILCAWRQHSSNTSSKYTEMFPEFIAAQERVAPKLSISRAELDKVQAELNFDAVAQFIRLGYRREAFEILISNVRGAPSYTLIASMLFRMAIPQSIFQWNRRRKQRNAVKQYGKLELGA